MTKEKINKKCYNLLLVQKAMDVLIYKKHQTKNNFHYNDIQHRLDQLIDIERKLKKKINKHIEKNKLYKKIIKV